VLNVVERNEAPVTLRATHADGCHVQAPLGSKSWADAMCTSRTSAPASQCYDAAHARAIMPRATWYAHGAGVHMRLAAGI
jgi:hypothetical protein